MRSRAGISSAKPGARIRLNLPMRSTIHAVCCGTKRMMVLAGREGRWKYEDGEDEEEDDIPRRLFVGADDCRLLEKLLREAGDVVRVLGTEVE